MSEQRKYVPINEATGSRVRFKMNFPIGTPAEQIGVNLGRLNKWCELGGLRTLTITGSIPERETPNIAGFNENGEAYAARSLAKAVTLVQTDLRPLVPGRKFPRAAVWADAVIDFNLQALQERVTDQGGVRSVKSWSDEMNKTLKNEVYKLGSTALLTGIYNPGASIPRSDVMDFVLGFCGAIGFAKFPLNEPESFHFFASHIADVLAAAALGFFVTEIVGNMIGYNRWAFDGGENWARQNKRTENDYYRFSIFNGMAFDRWANLRVRSWTQNLVKPIGES